MQKLPEVFDVAQHVQYITAVAYRFIGLTEASDMRLEAIQRRNKCVCQRVTCATGQLPERRL